MSNLDSNSSASSHAPRLGGQRLRGAAILLLALGVMLTPFALMGTLVFSVLGVLLAACGLLEVLEAFHASGERVQRSSLVGGALSGFAGLLLLGRPFLMLSALTLLLAATFFLYGLVKAIAAWRTRLGLWGWSLANGIVNLLIGIVIGSHVLFAGASTVTREGAANQFGARPGYSMTAFCLLIGMRLLVLGWSLIFDRRAEPAAPVPVPNQHPDGRLGLPPHAEFARLRVVVDQEERARRAIDGYWCLTFVATFFAIHVGRMEADWTLVGLLSPAVAVVGDVLTALIVAFAIILPTQLAWRASTRRFERPLWNGVLADAEAGRRPWLPRRLMQGWLKHRFRVSLRLRAARWSPRAALRWAFQVGLPWTAFLIAMNPIWGFSWYFNTENWATEVWDQWAEQRTDPWRIEMMQAVRQHYMGMSEAELFRVEPEGLAGAADFSFLVIGDSGTGDPSQQALRDQFVLLGQRPDVRFLVVSSDVIYPAGAMKDYERKFYLPYKGFTKPIYAIPGNHDWYDALEGFAANFLEADAARAAMRARVTADLGLTTTTDRHITRLIDQAAAWRREYGLRTGLQRGPYFEIQTERFALLMIDTGVLRSVDADQWRWLEGALARSRGKFIMAIPGHPFYAAGRYQGAADERFAALHELLRAHQVAVVMAGDTHDLEYYEETYTANAQPHRMHHFVNGGGGAYLSIGTPLAWPARPDVPNCAYYPRTDAIVAKLDTETPRWKRPLWFWVKRLGAWPSSAEAMAAAFDYNRAPFYQSFVEVRVEGSAGRVRLLPHGVNGRLRWRDLQTVGQLIPAGQRPDDPVEFNFPLFLRDSR